MSQNFFDCYINQIGEQAVLMNEVRNQIIASKEEIDSWFE